MHFLLIECINLLSLSSLLAERFRAAAKAISKEFGLTLFGFDVIVPTPTSSHSLRHNASAMGSQCRRRTGGSQQLQSCGKNESSNDSYQPVRSSSGAYHIEGGVLSGETCHSQSQERGRSSSHSSDCGSIEEEINAASLMTAPYSSSSLDNFGGDCHLVVIDVNFFTSYKEVPDFPQRLRKFLRKKAGMV